MFCQYGPGAGGFSTWIVLMASVNTEARALLMELERVDIRCARKRFNPVQGFISWVQASVFLSAYCYNELGGVFHFNEFHFILFHMHKVLLCALFSFQ